MAAITWTKEQRDAIERTGGSLIVSAAAGSGKTAVLAERCAYLVCDAPADRRCDLDQLLVVTFTEAAAAEMRSRIVGAIRERAEIRPEDRRLRQQIARAEAAPISTLHAFCLWVVRRGFHLLELDPTANLMDAAEADLLRREVLEGLFEQLYEPPAEGPEIDGRDGLRAGFQRLVSDYGLGNDRQIAQTLLRLHDFVRSLPEPDEWLDWATAAGEGAAKDRLGRFFGRMRVELELQIEECRRLEADISAGPEIGRAYALPVQEYGEQLAKWARQLPAGWVYGATDERQAEAREDNVEGLLAGCERVRQEIEDYEFCKVQGVRLTGASETLKKARDRAKHLCEDVRKKLFERRLRDGYAMFSSGEWLAGMQETATYAVTLAELVRALDEAYTRRKRALNVLDFADLERLTYELVAPREGAAVSPMVEALRNRFTHVLVDEFQDINPLQQAILRAVSREEDPDRANNLFAVGDVKQSIYRFRLAEPLLFLERWRGFRALPAGSAAGALTLQNNFRSRGEIIDAVNLVFANILRSGVSEIVYDEEAYLRQGRAADRADERQAVELHLLERKWDVGGEYDEDCGESGGALGDPSRWSAIEREAYLVGRRILELRRTSAPADGEPFWRRIAILLRAARVNAEQMASVLTAMGIPSYADAGGSLLAAREIVDVLSAVEVADNLQQDLPLAAVMRSGIFGARFSEDELVEIRCLDRGRPFHGCVAAYGRRGAVAELREKVARLLGVIRRFRREAARRPVAEVLWRMYHEFGFLAQTCGLPNGRQRHANLLKLHDLARRFGTFRRQGVHRFLEYVRSLVEEGSDLALAPTIGESEDVVRIMSIHQSKGLQFPVVFVAGLGTKFNLGDRAGRIIFERRTGLGLRRVDRERMAEYPTAAHRMAAEEIERTSREEEMRVLYVALTRAQDKLILVGSVQKAAEHAGEILESRRNEPPSRLEIISAPGALQMVLAAMRSAPAGAVRVEGRGGDASTVVFDVRVHDQQEMAGWSLERMTDPAERRTREAAAAGDPLPAHEPVKFDDPGVAAVLARADYVYPHLASAVTPAAVAASEVKRLFDWRAADEEAVGVGSAARGQGRRPGASRVKVGGSPSAGEEAARRGTATHLVLEHLDFKAASEPDGVASELQRLTGAGMLSAEEAALVDVDALGWLAGTELGRRLVAAGRDLRRELSFTALEPTGTFDPHRRMNGDDHVLVRGVVDAVLPGDLWIEFVDYKTDRLEPGEVAERVERYRPQMMLYARAVGRLWRRPVEVAWLVFLSPRRIVRLSRPADWPEGRSAAEIME